MVDQRNDQVGLVMGHAGPYVQLRPPQGGKEWDVPVEGLRRPTQAEELSAKVAAANGRWGTVGPRAVLRYETWTLEPDREPDAEPTTYAMQCAVDGEASPPGEDFVASQDWVLLHCGQHPSHHTYREIITRPWRSWRRT